jgi:hypothetical protein
MTVAVAMVMIVVVVRFMFVVHFVLSPMIRQHVPL